MTRTARIYVAGHRGMVGSAIVRRLRRRGLHATCCSPAPRRARPHGPGGGRAFFATERPDYVFLAAAKVGGIHANNSYPAEFIYQNLMIEAT
jgi:GDP-L-fucose synthase